MSRRRILSLAALVAALALVASACGKQVTGGAKKGGIFRIQTDGFEWNAVLDPTAEYLGFAFEFFNALHRPLLGYNHRLGSKGGNDVIPDLASDLGTVSADGLTWTFTLKSGVKFAPPVNRDVTSKDIANAFTRLASKELSAGGYATYYTELQGFNDVTAGKATTISGISTPDDKTIVFKLTKPVGEWRYRLTMAATAPMPEEVTKCFTKNGEYGRFQIASGPYMLEGTDKLDISSCAALKATPISGFDPTARVKIVRNPNYNAATDTKESRENLIDGVDLTLNTNSDDIFKKIEEGVADGESAQPASTVLQKCQTDAAFKDNCHFDPGDRTWYLFMNMAKAPFDDVHVRKAANWIVDKAGLVRARGGSLAGIVAEHIVPPDVLGGLLKQGEFDPYASSNHEGDVEKAKAEMKLSKYDTNKDGLCDAAACKNVLHVTRNTPPYTDMAPIIEESFKKIGITLQTKEVAKFYATVQVPSQTPPLGSGAGWGKDYASASTFYVPLLSSGAIAKEATQNFAYLGLTESQAKDIAYAWPAGGVPSADAGINACVESKPEQAGQCWADLDKKTMTDYVPWVPYLWAFNTSIVSDAVVQYEYDQFAGEVSFVHIGLDTTKQKTA